MTTAPPKRILIVDDDLETCRLVAELVTAPDWELHQEQKAADAINRARHERFDLVISDINLNGPESGLDVLKAFKEANPAGEVLLISGFGTLITAVHAVRAGAFDYISKPFNIREVKATVARALAQGGMPPLTTISPIPTPEGIVGRTAAMLTVYKQIAHAADTTAPVLISGESGTGKELVARAIHAYSLRASRPFVALNCGAVTETLLESELFGHVRGAFTGATSDRKGVFEHAHGGTVFLDEIGDMPLAMQVKLLRVLQDGEIRPVGSSRAIHVDARIVAATNVDTDRAVAEQRFREDLYYRLSVIVIKLPALRERPEDIPLLIDQFIGKAMARMGRQVALSPEATSALTAYRWPGNVRELENTIERLVLFSRGRIEVQDLPPTIVAAPPLQERLFQDLPSPHLVMTDVRMQKMTGIELCRRIRALSGVPIIVLSVKSAEETKVEALDAGADDYVTKPFGTSELLARVRAALRRGSDDAADLTPIEIGDFRIDLAARRVYVRGDEVRLTPKEFDLFLYLARRPNRVIEHRRLLEAVWGEGSEEHSEYLRVFVGQLRKKLEPNPSTPRYLATEPWVGYRFNACG